MFIKVLLPKIRLFPLEYCVKLKVEINIGDLVVVPFRNKYITGIVWETDITAKHKNPKEIIAVVNYENHFTISSTKYTIINDS